jgi:hypothetical protein
MRVRTDIMFLPGRDHGAGSSVGRVDDILACRNDVVVDILRIARGAQLSTRDRAKVHLSWPKYPSLPSIPRGPRKNSRSSLNTKTLQRLISRVVQSRLLIYCS